jgi:hypothetical protein
MLATSRNGYKWTDVDLNDLRDIAKTGAVYKLALAQVSELRQYSLFVEIAVQAKFAAIELAHAVSRRAHLRELRAYLPCKCTRVLM